MATRTQDEYLITLHWLTGEAETLTGWGDTPNAAAADAVRSAGYGGGALAALDYWSGEKKGA